ncbi:MAG TPA: SRPBCC family protein [Acidimicrobiales bacterium]
MDLTAGLNASCAPADLFDVVADLGQYADWLSIVGRVERLADEADGTAAWTTDLVGRLGPFSRSKRLRMARTHLSPPAGGTTGRVRFERRELDARRHAAWEMEATVEPTGDGCHLEMSLHYGGALWLPVLDRILRDEIESSRSRLVALVTAS